MQSNTEILQEERGDDIFKNKSNLEYQQIVVWKMHTD